jgi:hypothetical protein
MVGGQRLLLIVTQDAVGGRTLAYGSAFAFPGDTPVINPTAGAKTVLEFIFDAESAVWRLIATTALSSVQRMEVATIGAGIDTSAAVAVGAEYNGCKVVCSLKTNAGIINAAPVLFRGVVAGGNLTVSCVDTVTGLLSNVTAGVTVDCVLGF